MIKVYGELTDWFALLKLRYPQPDKKYIDYIRYIRDGNQCQLCGLEAHSVHHISPYLVGLVTGHAYKVNASSNLISLCHSCHSCIHANDYEYTHIDMILLALQGVVIHDDTWDRTLQKKAETNTLRVYGKGYGWFHNYSPY